MGSNTSVSEQSNSIRYAIGNDIDLDVLIDLYIDSTLGERRPVGDRQRMQSMLANANLVVTAWDAGLLVGIARSMTDWVYATYLSDLAVRQTYQGKGIGSELIRRTQVACSPGAAVILLSAPKAVGFYPKIGMTPHPAAFWLPPGQSLTR